MCYIPDRYELLGIMLPKLRSGSFIRIERYGLINIYEVFRALGVHPMSCR